MSDEHDLERFVSAQNASPSFVHELRAGFGGIDAMKLRSSLTLFHRAAPDEAIFLEGLRKFFGGAPDPATDEKAGPPKESGG